jgi:hypothetical protein
MAILMYATFVATHSLLQECARRPVRSPRGPDLFKRAVGRDRVCPPTRSSAPYSESPAARNASPCVGGSLRGVLVPLAVGTGVVVIVVAVAVVLIVLIAAVSMRGRQKRAAERRAEDRSPPDHDGPGSEDH